MSGADKEQIKKIQQSLNGIKSQISETAKQKEFWFRKKEELKQQINSLISDIKKIKVENDKSNIEVQELKKARNESNSKSNGIRERIRQLSEEKKKELKKCGIKLDPSRIKARIEELEKKVETETNFNREKKLMEEIKKLRKASQDFSGVTKIEDEIKKAYTELKDMNKKAKESNKNIKEIAGSSEYGRFMELSKKITELKKIQEDAFNKFIEFKNKYLQLGKDYKSKVEEAKPFREELEKEQAMESSHRAEREAKILRQKTEEVEQKIKSKKKLTTEDLLVFQGVKD